VNEVAADESSPAGYQDSFACAMLGYAPRLAGRRDRPGCRLRAGKANLTVIAQHQFVAYWSGCRCDDFGEPADEAGFDAPADVADRAVFEHDAILDFTISITTW